MVRLGALQCRERGCQASTDTERLFFGCSKCHLVACRDHGEDGGTCSCGRGGELRRLPLRPAVDPFAWRSLERVA